MPTTDAQDKRVQEIGASYVDSIRVTPNAGPYGNYAVVALPDGHTVVLGPEGFPIADSRHGSHAEDQLIHAIVSRPDERRGYDPLKDALLIERPDDEWVLVPPWRSMMETFEHLISPAVDHHLERLGLWAARVFDAPLRVFELRTGATEVVRRADV